jgi:hypothetical protein
MKQPILADAAICLAAILAVVLIIAASWRARGEARLDAVKHCFELQKWRPPTRLFESSFKKRQCGARIRERIRPGGVVAGTYRDSFHLGAGRVRFGKECSSC